MDIVQPANRGMAYQPVDLRDYNEHPLGIVQAYVLLEGEGSSVKYVLEDMQSGEISPLGAWLRSGESKRDALVRNAVLEGVDINIPENAEFTKVGSGSSTRFVTYVTLKYLPRITSERRWVVERKDVKIWKDTSDTLWLWTWSAVIIHIINALFVLGLTLGTANMGSYSAPVMWYWVHEDYFTTETLFRWNFGYACVAFSCYLRYSMFQVSSSGITTLI